MKHLADDRNATLHGVVFDIFVGADVAPQLGKRTIGQPA
jgi:hypothetical protein